MLVQLPQAHNNGKYDSNEKSLWFRVDDDNKMRINYILDTLSTEYTQQWIITPYTIIIKTQNM